MTRLALSIDNLHRLHHGVVAGHLFDRDGGIIGSRKADWLLVDRQRRIHPAHCAIRWLEGSFCVIDLCGQTLLNASPLPPGPGKPVRVGEGDCLQVGPYQLHARYQAGPSDQSFIRGNLDDLLKPGRQALEALLDSSLASPWHPAPRTASLPVDICTLFDRLQAPDPLAALTAPQQPAQPGASALQRLIAGGKP